MIVEPVISGVVAKTSHPEGCKKAVDDQIAYVKSASPIKNGPKRVLILGASSGFGLAARIASHLVALMPIPLVFLLNVVHLTKVWVALVGTTTFTLSNVLNKQVDAPSISLVMRSPKTSVSK